MPIRFRCAYCNQLMGIARRKAGTVVRCPTCSGQVVVPNPELDAPGGNPPPLFERSDFDKMLEQSPVIDHPVLPPAGANPEIPPAPHGAWGTHPEPAFPAEKLHPVPALPPPSAPGVFLSPTRVTLIVVVVILLIAVAFGGGLLVGKFLLS